LLFIIRTPGKSVAMKGPTIPDADKWVAAVKSLITTSLADDDDDEDVKKLLYKGT
jgi:hypothetical protein